MFWQAGPVPMNSAQWAARQRELVRGDAWILDGDLGPYDQYLDIRLQAADTVIVLDFGFARCAWRTLRRGRERVMGRSTPARLAPRSASCTIRPRSGAS